jgi:adenylosuccinate lyase
VFSQPVLLALVRAGLTRDEAYRIVQDAAARSWDEDVSFRELLDNDPRVTVEPSVLDEAFDLERSVRLAGRAIDALDALADTGS